MRKGWSGGRSLHSIALYVPPKKESAWKKKGRLSDVVWTKIWKCKARAASGGFQTLEQRLHASFAVGRVKAVFCHFPSCHFQDQHLATSCTSCFLFCFFFSLSTDRWYKSFDTHSIPQPSSKKVCLCGTFIKWSHAPVTAFILLPELRR